MAGREILQLQDNGVPVYVQIRDQMLQAIGAGQLRPGEQMPTLRQVAVSLKVDQIGCTSGPLSSCEREAHM
jgi:DNA-binding transcriptional regulator YhcF (GntR family)